MRARQPEVVSPGRPEGEEQGPWVAGDEQMPDHTPASLGSVNRAVDGVTNILLRVERDLKDDMRRREQDEKEKIEALRGSLAELAAEHKQTRQMVVEQKQERDQAVFAAKLLKMVGAGVVALIIGSITFFITVVSYLSDGANFRVTLDQNVDKVITEQSKVANDLKQITPP